MQTHTQQQVRRAQLYSLLGDLPDRDRPVTATLLETKQEAGYERSILSLDLNGEEAVPAYFIKPHHAKGKLPVILFSHAHGRQYWLGKDEIIRSHTCLPGVPYAEAFVQLGFAVLCIDHWLFGERNIPGRTESTFCKEMLWRGRVPWGMMVYDSIKALDYLAQREDVDAARIGAIGMSMGSTMSWWLAALDERVSVCVDICCLTDFDALIAHHDVDAHGLYYYVPGLLKHFTAAQINALIAPRPHLALAGNHDPLTPADGLERIDLALQKTYEAHGKPEAWKLFMDDTGHCETPAMRKEALAFLKEWL